MKTTSRDKLKIEFSNYFLINSEEPAITEPTGAPRPLLKQILTEEHPLTILEGGTSRATAAFISLAPSMWIGSSNSLHTFSN